jgi:hypothetical protein
MCSHPMVAVRRSTKRKRPPFRAADAPSSRPAARRLHHSSRALRPASVICITVTTTARLL